MLSTNVSVAEYTLCRVPSSNGSVRSAPEQGVIEHISKQSATTDHDSNAAELSTGLMK